MAIKDARNSRVEVLDFKSKHKKVFRDLNYEWLQEYFHVEPYDEIVLGDPEGQIIRRGGCVLLARLGDEIVGACALLKHTELKYELAKMGVTEKARGHGIGTRLIEAAIKRARDKGAETLVLATSPVLEAANRLYTKMGFRLADPDVIGPLPYSRHTIVMSLDLLPTEE
jgi:putative acetyltransferase